MQVKALLTPGHSPGHLCFHLEDENVLISGDLGEGLQNSIVRHRNSKRRKRSNVSALSLLQCLKGV